MNSVRNIPGVRFTSSICDLSKLRNSDLLYITYISLFPDISEVPPVNIMFQTIKHYNIESVDIILDPRYKFTFTAILHYAE